MIEHIREVKVAWKLFSLAHLNMLVIHPGVFSKAQKFHFSLPKQFQAQEGPTASPFIFLSYWVVFCYDATPLYFSL